MRTERLTGKMILVNRTAGPAGTAPKPLDGVKGMDAASVKALQQTWAKSLNVPVEETVEVAQGVKMSFVLIPPGQFRMGSPADEADRSYDEDLHTVTITQPFYLGKSEVTPAQYTALSKKNQSKFKGEDLPVEGSPWGYCSNFASKLADVRNDGHLYRPPTEAEWEYACRGGRPFGIGDGRTPTGDLANFNGKSRYGSTSEGQARGQTMKAGSFPTNASRLYDMHGNLNDWCADRYEKHFTADADDSSGESDSANRVARGGSYQNDGKACRSAARRIRATGRGAYFTGFRLLRTVGQQVR